MATPERSGDEISRLVAAELRGESARAQIQQLDVAAALDRSQAYVSLRWNGKASLTVDEFARWCALLGTDPGTVMRAALDRELPPARPAAKKKTAAPAKPRRGRSRG